MTAYNYDRTKTGAKKVDLDKAKKDVESFLQVVEKGNPEDTIAAYRDLNRKHGLGLPSKRDLDYRAYKWAYQQWKAWLDQVLTRLAKLVQMEDSARKAAPKAVELAKTLKKVQEDMAELRNLTPYFSGQFPLIEQHLGETIHLLQGYAETHK